MRKISLLLPLALLLLTLAACGGDSGLDKLNGKWVGDAAATMALEGQAAQTDMEKMIAEKMFGSIFLEVDAAKKTLTITFGDNVRTAEFTLEKQDGNRFTLKTPEPLVLELKDNDMLLFSDGSAGPDKGLMMRRVK